jgi:hypothetical protein
MTKVEVRKNLNISLKKIKNLISVSASGFVENLHIHLEDMDYSEPNSELYMVLLHLRFEAYSDNDFNGFLKSCTEINDKMNSFMDMISFDNEGNLKTRKSGGVLQYTGQPLVSKIEFSHKDDEVELQLDYMFYN